MTSARAETRKVAAARLSVISNAALIVMKTAAGITMGSVSIISEAAHSAVDLVAALIALFSVKNSGKPADRDHPFGHGKIENISGTVEAVLIFLAAGWIIYEAFMRFVHPKPLEALGWGIGVMLLSCLVNVAVSENLFHVGRQTDSIALQADAWHLRTDVYTSAGVMAGLVAIWAGERLVPGVSLHWIDPAAAIAVALLIVRAAWRLTVQSSRDLLDATLPAAEKDVITGLIASRYPEVKGYHKLRTRKSGHMRFVEFHMLVDPDMNVQRSHGITDELTGLITDRLPHSTVTIHVEPCDGRCDEECLLNCMLRPRERPERKG
ncbi:MAG TPA: cation diffusion facilitator family transporter [Deltaproteobacteria bacterium]|nr:cation diffusion facilitator family transporter [Deltaproteobacteria bacterium]HNS90264.1 cation diffusion facilitator family transporter [Deltaproteobacteria bacterium]HOA44976.1 cation diffusion facilitator family transporter [Deltaproteobacteria bacterium]HOG83608.1 cation diffusion facilitator family transporter [Deltaproteobacteria bacterium]